MSEHDMLIKLLRAASDLRYTQRNIGTIPVCVMQEKEVKLDRLIDEIKEQLKNDRPNL